MNLTASLTNLTGQILSQIANGSAVNATSPGESSTFDRVLSFGIPVAIVLMVAVSTLCCGRDGACRRMASGFYSSPKDYGTINADLEATLEVTSRG